MLEFQKGPDSKIREFQFQVFKLLGIQQKRHPYVSVHWFVLQTPTSRRKAVSDWIYLVSWSNKLHGDRILKRPNVGSTTFLHFTTQVLPPSLEAVLQRTISMILLFINNGCFGGPVCEFWGPSSNAFSLVFWYLLTLLTSVWIHMFLIFWFQDHHLWNPEMKQTQRISD